MNRDRHERLGELFELLCELPREEQLARLEEEAGGDRELFRRVRDLLESDAATGARALDRPPHAIDLEGLGTAPAPPATIGSYRVLRTLGRGGMGVVLEAEQENPRRRVAIKMLRGDLWNESLAKRFEHEAQILGWLDHPGIAEVYEAGVTEDQRPYIVMELVEGRPLLEHVETAGLGLEEQLELVATIADAVHHAHQRGVIHRDLKPSNVLVDEHGRARVLDFGIARVTDADLDVSTIETRAGDVLGTLPYMSPEQLRGDPSELDVRTDVYSLGVMAYQLLGHDLPHAVRGKTLAEAARLVAEEDPTTLSSRRSELRGDVETIVMKALAKEKERRYESAGELASDLRRFLAHEPITARPASSLYQLSRFARRNRALVAGVVSAFVCLAIGLVVSLVLYVQSEDRGERLAVAFEKEQRLLAEARDARALADLETERAEQALEDLLETETYFNEIFSAAEVGELGTEVKVADVLARMTASLPTAFPDRPLARARLLQRVGRTFVALGEAEAGGEFLLEAHALLDAHGEQTPREALERQIDLGRAANGRLDAAAASEHYGTALELLAEDGRAVSTTAWALHVDLLQSRITGWQLEGIEDAIEEARSVARELGGPALDDRLATCLRIEALAFNYSGRLEDSERAARAALATLQETRAPDDVRLLDVHEVLASTLARLGKPREALEHMRTAHDGFRRRIGRDHEKLAELLEGLGVMHLSLHRNAEALQHLEDALAMSDRLRPRPNRTAAVLLGHLAFAQSRLGREELSIATYEEAVAAFRTVGGARDGNFSSLLSNLAVQYHEVGRPAAGIPLMEEALEIRRTQADPSNVRVEWDALALVQMLLDAGEPARAETHLELALRSTRAKGPSESSVIALTEQARCLRLLGRPGDGLDVLENLIAAVGEPDSSPRWSIARLELGACLFDAGEEEAGRAFLEEALAVLGGADTRAHFARRATLYGRQYGLD